MTGASNRVRAAQHELEVAQASLARSTAPLRASLRRHPATWLLGGGFAAGLAAGLLPAHRWAQTGLRIATAGARLLAPFLAGIEADEQRGRAERAGETTLD